MSGESGILWIVATPIGTIDDLGARAREVLGQVELILAEDTRRTRTLLTAAGVAARGRVRSLHEHNEHRVMVGVLDILTAGNAVAIVSDAGTPTLCDPGFLLVREVLARGVRVCSVPGPSSFTAALAASGQPPMPATLVGFLPPRRGARRRRVLELAAVPWTMVILLSPHRLAAELADLAEGLGGDRPATLMAELSKVHERALSLTLGELALSDEAASPRGEYVVVVGPAPVADAASVEAEPGAVREAYEEALAADVDRRQAVKDIARRFGLSRSEAYSMVHGRNQD